MSNNGHKKPPFESHTLEEVRRLADFMEELFRATVVGDYAHRDIMLIGLESDKALHVDVQQLIMTWLKSGNITPAPADIYLFFEKYLRRLPTKDLHQMEDNIWEIFDEIKEERHDYD